MEYIGIIIVAIFVNNVVLAQFLGICPFLGVSKKVDTAIGMSAAVTFVLTIATIVTFLLQKGLLEPFGLQYLQTITFILVIASLVQMVEIVIKKVSPPLYQALGVFLPLITTNCVILGVAILVIQKDFTLLSSVVYAVATAAGYALALIIFSTIREQLALTKVPKAMQGVPIALITAGILAMAFMGFSGIEQVF
ncbi:MAG: electron transport complex subunit RsxA [Dysgonamonadaceae bacterium]|jgi:electron transport complex protein RnfA|nr:electron transport complex subunit RsxA [Dysgonamonadaceae bacterium]MDD3355916.1 electron transport complex subunit RsxA [Dysgonamonadaceae bacterium]MDD3727005.1 electron transport complex subunit RsxA [Dysgonamonadaceae bacterium]MDD4245868.1 electron transport complex subunit RsxA [Dysgonamonadaceae bacterium]MDD4605094.1 electron transport complex subunit RsxA [Dysgonamonadaceae bacterium]